LDGVKYHHVFDLEVGYASVPVEFKDEFTRIIHEMLLVAGSVGMQLSSNEKGSGRDKEDQRMSQETAVLDTVQPVFGWWIFEKMEPKGRIGHARII